MNRPERQRAHLIEKLASKESRTTATGKVGKRAKRWKKLIAQFQPAATEPTTES